MIHLDNIIYIIFIFIGLLDCLEDCQQDCSLPHVLLRVAHLNLPFAPLFCFLDDVDVVVFPSDFQNNTTYHYNSHIFHQISSKSSFST